MALSRLDRRQVRRSFERAAATYDQAAVVQRQMADELLERLQIIKIEPRRILDAGCGTGYARPGLMRRFPRAEYLGNDIAPAMLRRARPTGPFSWRERRRSRWFCGDVEGLPLKDGSVDLVFCNAVLQWCQPEAAFAEMRRVLAPRGVLMFSTFGPDTLRELRQVWAEVDTHVHVHEFIDMHVLGDILVETGFELPVVDVSYLTVTHRTLLSCLKDLRAIGASNAAQDRARGLMPRSRLRALDRTYEARRNREGRIETTYELVYGHAWAGEFRQTRETDGAASVPLSQIGRRR